MEVEAAEPRRRGQGMQTSLVGPGGGLMRRRQDAAGCLRAPAVGDWPRTRPCGQVTRRHHVWPGNNTFLCDGRIMMVRTHARLSVCPVHARSGASSSIVRCSCSIVSCTARSTGVVALSPGVCAWSRGVVARSTGVVARSRVTGVVACGETGCLKPKA